MSRRQMRGFTLLEVVIAFAILGMTLTALYGAFQNGLARMQRDAKVSEATLLARSLLARAVTELQPGDPVQGRWNAYDYLLTQEPIAPPGRQPPFTVPMIHVTASVSWSSQSGPQSVVISTLKLLPRTHP